MLSTSADGGGGGDSSLFVEKLGGLYGNID
ncbi:unnamed protein product, partial [Rotaria magnacalcarata]